MASVAAGSTQYIAMLLEQNGGRDIDRARRGSLVQRSSVALAPITNVKIPKSSSPRASPQCVHAL